MKQVIILLVLSFSTFIVSAPTEEDTPVIKQILAAINGNENLSRIASYIARASADHENIFPVFGSDGKTKASYTFFFPTTSAFIRQTPQDGPDPILVNLGLGSVVLSRHYTKQLISPEDLDKVETIVMADSNEATVTRDAGVRKINGEEILDDVIELPNGTGFIYVIDKVFMSAEEVSQVLAKAT